MTGGVSHAAGKGVALRLDPAALPLRYHTGDKRADGQERTIDLLQDRVVVRRRIGGLAMKVQVPMSAYRGVSVRFLDTPNGEECLSVVLEHDDPDLCLPLCWQDEADDLVHQWQNWSQSLALPLLVTDPAGRESIYHAWLGAVCVRKPIARRRRHSPHKDRRPSALLRRKSGHSRPTAVHHEVEIIARDMLR